jgi:hypothetical protein
MPMSSVRKIAATTKTAIFFIGTFNELIWMPGTSALN